jgi:hypothetical protein
MKRVWLQHPGRPFLTSDLRPITDPELVRRAWLAIVAHGTGGDAGRDLGDPVYEKVTEGRHSASVARILRGSKEAPYSPCGDLPHWALDCLGVRDELLVNRTGDEGVSPWAMGKNLSRLVWGEGRRYWQQARGSAIPPIGAILLVAEPEHVCVLDAWGDDEVITHDYAQWNAQRGHFASRRRSRLRERLGLGWQIEGRMLQGWLDPLRVPLMESALVPDDFDGGIEDTNPYHDDGGRTA